MIAKLGLGFEFAPLVSTASGRQRASLPAAPATDADVRHLHMSARKLQPRLRGATTPLEPDQERTIIERFAEPAADAEYAVVLLGAARAGRPSLKGGRSPRGKLGATSP